MNDIKKSKKYVLLSKLIKKLNEIDYYQTFAKTLLVTTNSIPKDSNNTNYVEYMFHYFIDNENLNIYYNNKEFNTENFKKFSEFLSINFSPPNTDWGKEIYINLNDLKKLYANKCIVFPVSLIKEIQDL